MFISSYLLVLIASIALPIWANSESQAESEEVNWNTSDQSSFNSVDPTSVTLPSIVYTNALKEACDYVLQQSPTFRFKHRRQVPLILHDKLPKMAEKRRGAADYTETVRQVCNQLLASEEKGQMKEKMIEKKADDIKALLPSKDTTAAPGTFPPTTLPKEFLDSEDEEAKIKTVVKVEKVPHVVVELEKEVEVAKVVVVEVRDSHGTLVGTQVVKSPEPRARYTIRKD